MMNIQNDVSAQNGSVAFRAKTGNNLGRKFIQKCSYIFNPSKRYAEKADEFKNTSLSVFYKDAIRKAFLCEDVDIKTFKAMVKKAVDAGELSKEEAKIFIGQRKFNDFVKSPFITKILEKYCKK